VRRARRRPRPGRLRAGPTPRAASGATAATWSRRRGRRATPCSRTAIRAREITDADLDPIRADFDSYEAARRLGRLLADRHGVTWIPRVDPLDTKGHTGEDVPLYAGGPGAERFGGVLDNAEIPKRLRALLGW
jgi:hypothetical protein